MSEEADDKDDMPETLTEGPAAVAPTSSQEPTPEPSQEQVQVPADVESTLPEDAPRILLARFEGPLDLLLYLIRRDKLDIYDIPIAPITRQYMEYLELMQEMNLDVAGEFMVMAATLIHIKSKLCLLYTSPSPRD